ncbi:MAG: hypothetical protein ACRDP7_04555 [Trebonia sp.]
MTEPAALATEAARLPTGVLAAELADVSLVPDAPGPVSAEAADVADWSGPGWSSLVAA